MHRFAKVAATFIKAKGLGRVKQTAQTNGRVNQEPKQVVAGIIDLPLHDVIQYKAGLRQVGGKIIDAFAHRLWDHIAI